MMPRPRSKDAFPAMSQWALALLALLLAGGAAARMRSYK